MTEDFKKLFLYFYNESLKHEVNTTAFIENSTKVTKEYRETFGMTKTWHDYQKALKDDNKPSALSLLDSMLGQLLEH